MKRKAVVWISTVLYVLISFAIIGLLLAALRPKIAETRDSFLIEQTIQSLNIMDDSILIVKNEAQGAVRTYRIRLDKGDLTIDGFNEKIYWQAISNAPGGEPNVEIPVVEGVMTGLTVPSGNLWNVTLKLDYSNRNMNITVNGKDDKKTLTPASLEYKIFISNMGMKAGKQQIDFSIS